jgi:SPP1 gp7 family putative phage head morphogenesis protein
MKAYVRNIERERKPFYKTAKADMLRALKVQTDEFKVRLRKCDTPEEINYQASKSVDSEPITKAMQSIYVKTGKHFAVKTYNGLTKSKQMKRVTQPVTEDYWFDYMNRFVTAKLGQRIRWITGTTEDVFKDTCRRITSAGIETGASVETMAREIMAKLDVTQYYRAERIARTEVNTASNEASIAGAKATGLELVKEWMSFIDEKTRDSHAFMNGVTVGIDEKFEVPDAYGVIDLMDYPLDPAGSASNVIECRCTIGYNGAEGGIEWGRF